MPNIPEDVVKMMRAVGATYCGRGADPTIVYFFLPTHQEKARYRLIDGWMRAKTVEWTENARQHLKTWSI